MFIFTRILGHYEVVGGHKWVERKVCYICQNWKYLIVIWSELLQDNFYEIGKRFIDVKGKVEAVNSIRDAS